MSISQIIGLFSGVALFLYGMSLMGDGLKQLSGNKLGPILFSLSSTQIKGVLFGTAVTAVIQSSCATPASHFRYSRRHPRHQHHRMGHLSGLSGRHRRHCQPAFHQYTHRNCRCHRHPAPYVRKKTDTGMHWKHHDGVRYSHVRYEHDEFLRQFPRKRALVP